MIASRKWWIRHTFFEYRHVRHVEKNVSEVLATITPKLCQQVIANMRRCLQLCDQLGGRHFEHLL